MNLNEHLCQINACHEAREWARGKTSKEAWETCPDYDWLAWWICYATPKTEIRTIAPVLLRYITKSVELRGASTTLMLDPVGATIAEIRSWWAWAPTKSEPGYVAALLEFIRAEFKQPWSEEF